MKKYVKSANVPEESYPYRYVMKHGTGPGTIPKDVKVGKVIDDDFYSQIYINRPLTEDELSYYDIPHEWEVGRYIDETPDGIDPEVADYKKATIIKQLENLLHKHRWNITREAITYKNKFYLEAWSPAEDCHLEVIAPIDGDRIVQRGTEFYVDGEQYPTKEIPAIIKEKADMAGYTTLTARPKSEYGGVEASYNNFSDEDPYHGFRWYCCDCGYESFHRMDEDDGMCPSCYDHHGAYGMVDPDEDPSWYEDIKPEWYEHGYSLGGRPDYDYDGDI